MKPVPESFSVVMIGNWNPAILRPEWISQQLFPGQEIEWQVMFPFGAASAPTKFRGNNLEFIPAPNRFEIKPTNNDFGGMRDALNCSLRVLQILSHTPINAIGINFSYSDDSSEFNLSQVAEFNDTPKYSSEEYQLESIAITRSFKIKSLENTMLNLKIIPQQNSVFEFNFHHQFNSTNEYIEHLNNLDIEKIKTAISDVIEEIYDCTLEDA